ncbi:hypothetical protein AAMO2058_001033300 [Amorphochlora amoebiformis]
MFLSYVGYFEVSFAGASSRKHAASENVSRLRYNKVYKDLYPSVDPRTPRWAPLLMLVGSG